MDSTKCLAALFDFDGVVMDTESQYSKFWDVQEKIFFPEIENFAKMIKGNTLAYIFEKYMSDSPEKQKALAAELVAFEATMQYDYVPGFERFLQELKKAGIKTVIVTSSAQPKMQCVYKAHPEILESVDRILTAEMFTQSKPHPECFLLGAKLLDTVPENCVVFEDSFNGLAAGNAAGMKVVGLSTTNSKEAIADKAHVVIPDFHTFTVEQMIELLQVKD